MGDHCAQRARRASIVPSKRQLRHSSAALGARWSAYCPEANLLWRMGDVLESQCRTASAFGDKRQWPDAFGHARHSARAGRPTSAISQALQTRWKARFLPSRNTDSFNYTRHEPYGVVAAITPWNSPLLLVVWKLAPGLAAGCTFVLKPHEVASVGTLELAALLSEAGCPPGVVNVVTGTGTEVGEPLVSHPKVRKIAFTGGDVAGRAIYQTAARDFKPVTLELGGKSAKHRV